MMVEDGVEKRYMTKEEMDEYIRSGRWPNARAHEGCEFIEDVVTGGGLKEAVGRMMEKFRRRQEMEKAKKSKP